MRKVLFSSFILLILILSACNESTEPEKNDNEEDMVTPVETEKVDTGDFVVEKSIYGHISPRNQTPVMLQQPGEVTTLKIENGDEVKKDDHLATIKTQMGNQTIYASADGEMAHVNAEEGSFLSNEEPFALIIDVEKVHATFTVTAATKDYFEKDDTVTVLIDDEKYEGTVLAMDTMPNETGQYPVVVEIDNEDRDISPGMTAKMMIADQRVKDAIIIPTAAVMTESEESFVFIVSDHVAKKVSVEIKESQSEQTAVKGDLAKDDDVIVNGHFTLSDGSKVDVVKEGK